MSAERSLATPVAALLLLSILVLGAWLRLDGLADPPLWWDEGINAYFAGSSPARLLAMARASHDTDPPAHRLALKPWLAVVGRSAWSLRLLSVVCGLLTIVVTYAWGSWLWGRPTGLLAASLLALMPIAIYYSREAKAYPFVTLFGTLGSYLWARYLVAPDAPAPRRRLAWQWAAFAFMCALAVGAHYYAALLMAAQGVWLLARLALRGPLRPSRQALGHWLLAQGAAAALVLPWPLLTFRSAVSGALGLEKGPPAWHLLGFLREVGSSLAAGPYGGGWAAWVALAVLGLAGLWCLARDRRPRVLLLACLVAVPLALAFALQGWVHFFAPRFLLYVSPPLCLLAAHGLMRLRWVGAALAAALAVAWFTLLPEARGPLVAPEEDLRPLARALSEMAQPSDAVVVGYTWQEGALSLYAPDLAAPYYLGWYTTENVADEMAALWRQHPRIWLLSYRVPERHSTNPAGSWLEENALRALVQQHGDSRLTLYLPPCSEDWASGATVAFEEALSLEYVPADVAAQPGEFVLVRLRWGVAEAPPEGYIAFLHLLGPDGQVVSQVDGAPRNGLRPFTTVPPNGRLAECRVLWVPSGAPAGTYPIEVGLYDAATGRRLRVADGPQAGADHLILGAVQVGSSP